MKNIALKHGVALVLTGPQGCGKSTIAKEIAKQYGSYAVAETNNIGHAFGLSDALAAKPNTLILEGWPNNEQVMHQIKQILTSEFITCHRKYKKSSIVKSPNLIFCTGHHEAIPIDTQDRRFFVVQVGPRA